MASSSGVIVVVPGPSDSSLSALNVANDSMTPLAPGFMPTYRSYQTVAGDSPSAAVTWTAGTGGATAGVKVNGVAQTVSGSSALVPLTRNRNDIVVTVTSSDESSTTSYTVTVWRLAAPVSRIVRLSNAHSTVYGGARMTVTLADGSLPANCYRSYEIGGQSASLDTASVAFDPVTGYTTEMVGASASRDYQPGSVDVTVQTACFAGGGFVVATNTAADAFTYTAGYPIDSADIPATVTSGSSITFHGVDVNSDAQVEVWIEDAQGVRQNLDDWSWTGNDNAVRYVDYDYDSWYQGSGPRTLHVAACGGKLVARMAALNGGPQQCTSLFTRTINWVAPKPADVSFSPTSGPVLGGTTVRLKGRFLSSGTDDEMTIKVGDQEVPSYDRIYGAEYDGDTFDQYTKDYDIIEFVTPPAASAGPVPITVTTTFGTTAARGTFMYAQKPVISSITPASVANTGGSTLTVLGANFGTTGTPTVIIGGVKSPLVTRVSATKLTAVVPASATVGPVGVTVASPQGGGLSTAATLTLVAATTLPTVTAFTPAAGKSGDVVTATGTGFGPAGTAGVTVDGRLARVTANSATSITFEVPATDTAGVKNVVVASITGTVTKTAAFTVRADDGITAVTPATIASYATGAGAKVTLTGAGFGAKGTVKVGAAAAVAYTATGAGTSIAGVVVPTGVAGSLPIVVTPTGVTTTLRSSVRVTGPAITYVGPDPRDVRYTNADIDGGNTGFILDVPITGAAPMRIEGSGFGPGGVLTMGTTVVDTSSWTNSAITFTAPAHAMGSVALRVTPTGSSLSAARTDALRYVAAVTGQPTIARIASVVDLGHYDRNEFDPAQDVNNAFTIAGTNLAGATPSATRITITGDEGQEFTVTPSVVTPTSLTFATPRGFNGSGGWKSVLVVTDLGSDSLNYGVYYLNAGVQLGANPTVGLCLKAVTAASGSVSYTPAVVTMTASGEAFGATGTVTIDGVAISPSSYTSGQIVFDMASLARELTNPWGGKQIVVTPADTDLAPQSVGFTCGVLPSVATTLNGSAEELTIAAGTNYTPGFTTTGFIGATPLTVATPGGYEYVTADSYQYNGFNYNVKAGLPVGAGDYYIRVAMSRATYAAEKYLDFSPTPVHLTITGTPITITPVSKGGASLVYKGGLSSPADFDYTPSSVADEITAVTWEYRDQVCSGQGADAGWNEGLPSNVAMSTIYCGGDGVTQSSWEVRVKSFEMKTTGTDRAIFYQATFPSTGVTITPRPLTVSAVRADRVYNGTTTATFGDLTVNGAVEADNVGLDNDLSTGEFADANAGVNKPVTLAADLVLAGPAKANYTLINPRPAVFGTITKASAVLSLAASTSSVLLTQNAPVTITPTVKDTRTNAVVADEADAAPVVLTSQTSSVCTVAGTTVTAIAPGTCIIAGSQIASVNYQAAVAASDDTSTTETIEIEVLGGAQTITVVADDVTVAVGDPIDLTAQVSGLFDGDEVTGVQFDLYDGSTLVESDLTEPGTYRIVPKNGTLQAANNAAYTNPNAFTYVGGTLVITAQPPTITSFTPDSGYTTGGTPVTVTGTLLDTVRAVRIGAVTLRTGSFTVNEDGTSLTFTTPRTATEGVVDLVLVAGTASAQDVYTYTTSPVVVTPPGVPSPFTVIPADRQFAVVFGPPASTGGSPITAYQASYDGGRTWRPVATVAHAGGTRAFIVRLLNNGVTYTVRIRAVNISGPGAATVTRSVVTNSPRLAPIVHPGTEIAVPKNPDAYRGPQRYTKARNTTHAGRDAHPITTLGAHQLMVGEAATLSKKGLFDFDSARLTAMGRAEVRLLATHLLIANRVTCEGYTDYAGQAGHELTLSRQRAAAVCAALVSYGADVRTVNVGYGQARPVIVGGTPVSREANRRVVVVVTA